MNNGLISVIVPVYNVQRFLSDCIESIIKQTYEKLEIMLVDDGSTDDSGKICDNYAQKDTRIKVIHKENGGLSDARNVALDICEGEYITFVDSDDVITVDMVEYLWKLQQNTDADIVTCQTQLISEDGQVIPKNQQYSTRIITGNENCMLNFLTARDMDTAACMKLFKKDLFKEIRFPFGKYSEDLFTVYKLVALSNIVVVGEEKKYVYRIRNASIMHQEFSKKHLDVVEGAILRAEFVAKEYPQLLTYANAGIINAVNVCTLKIIECNQRVSELKDTIHYLQSLYRKYTKDVLLSKNRGRVKLFSMLAIFNLNFIVKICKSQFIRNFIRL